VLRRDESTRRSKALSHWLGGSAPLDAVDGDRDIYGDGSAVMLSLPGHTPGHHGLLLHLSKTGTVLLSGDTVHFRENYDNRDLPAQNTSRSESIASIDRVRALIAHTNAIFVIEHDARDVEKLHDLPCSSGLADNMGNALLRESAKFVHVIDTYQAERLITLQRKGVHRYLLIIRLLQQAAIDISVS
jgi:glyoxylase-like metal-dependent hydrolase (beta-lactamase superfamily II)